MSPDAYEIPATYNAFLKDAIKRHWDANKSSKLELLALLLASREAWEVVIDGATSPEGRSRALKGAAGAAALTVLLRTVVGGPLGLLLTGVSAASLVALYVRYQDQIWLSVDHYKRVIDDYRPRFDRARATCDDKALEPDEAALLLDGLMARFLAELAAVPKPTPKAKPEEPTPD
jgi:hypothetical protein